MLKQVFVLFFLFSVAFADSFYYVFKDTYEGIESKKFVVKLIKKEDIEHAEQLLNGTTTDRPHIQGSIVKGRVHYNEEYNYSLDPYTIQFFNNATESCDYDFEVVHSYIKDVCTKNAIPGCIMCPSTSKVVDGYAFIY